MAFDGKAVGARIAAARKLRGMTQEDLARAAKLNKFSVYRYENGETVPGTDRLVCIAEVLGVSPNDLLGYSEMFAIT